MSWRRYQNELIVLGAFVLMLLAYMYKYNQTTAQTQHTQEVAQSLEDVKEVVALKKLWADKTIGKKMDDFHALVPSSKVIWSKKSKKVTASYKGLGANELNKLITKMLNLPVQITLLDIQKTGSTYNVEFKCKW